MLVLWKIVVEPNEPNLDESGRLMPTRRSVLKTAGVASGAALSGVHTVKAKESEYDQGSVTFIEMKLQYGSVPSYPRLTGDNLVDYSVENNRSRVLLTGAAPKQVMGGHGVISEARSFSIINETVTQVVGRDAQMVTPDTDYRHLHATYLELNSPRQRPTVTTELINEEIDISTQNKSMHVESGSEESMELEHEEVSVSTRDGGTRKVTLVPKLHVRNHGELRVLGAENKRLIPLDSEDP
jgi:hypothetical protein